MWILKYSTVGILIILLFSVCNSLSISKIKQLNAEIRRDRYCNHKWKSIYTLSQIDKKDKIQVVKNVNKTLISKATNNSRVLNISNPTIADTNGIKKIINNDQKKNENLNNLYFHILNKTNITDNILNKTNITDNILNKTNSTDNILNNDINKLCKNLFTNLLKNDVQNIKNTTLKISYDYVYQIKSNSNIEIDVLLKDDICNDFIYFIINISKIGISIIDNNCDEYMIIQIKDIIKNISRFTPLTDISKIINIMNRCIN